MILIGNSLNLPYPAKNLPNRPKALWTLLDLINTLISEKNTEMPREILDLLQESLLKFFFSDLPLASPMPDVILKELTAKKKI